MVAQRRIGHVALGVGPVMIAGAVRELRGASTKSVIILLPETAPGQVS